MSAIAQRITARFVDIPVNIEKEGVMENEVDVEVEYQLSVYVSEGSFPALVSMTPRWSEYIEQLFETGSILKGIDLNETGDYLVDVDLYEDGTTNVVGILYNEGWVEFEY